MDSLPDAELIGLKIGQRTKEIAATVARDVAGEVAGQIVRKALPTDQQREAEALATLRSQARLVLVEGVGAQIGAEEVARQQADAALGARIDGAVAQAEKTRADLVAMIESASAKLAAVDQSITNLTNAVAEVSTAAQAAQAEAARAVELATPPAIPKGATPVGLFWGEWKPRAYPVGSVVRDPTGLLWITVRPAQEKDDPSDKSRAWVLFSAVPLAVPSVGTALAIRQSNLPAVFVQDDMPPPGPGNALAVFGPPYRADQQIRLWCNTLTMRMAQSVQDAAGGWIWVESGGKV